MRALTNPLSAAVGSLTFACYADEVAKRSQPPQQLVVRGSPLRLPRVALGVESNTGVEGQKISGWLPHGEPIALKRMRGGFAQEAETPCVLTRKRGQTRPPEPEGQREGLHRGGCKGASGPAAQPFSASPARSSPRR